MSKEIGTNISEIPDKPNSTGHEKTCENCHATVSGSYCSECGQSIESNIKYFWSVILHLLDDIFSFDSRASRTLIPLLFNPGFLTNEYIAGRRVHYVPPLRLYLFISIVFFLSLKLFMSPDLEELANNSKESATVIQQISSELEAIKQQRLFATPPELLSLDENLARLTQYHKDILNKQNKSLAKVTLKLAQLELARIKNNGEITEEKQAEYKRLTSQVDELKTENIKDSSLTIGNNEDGSFTLSSLSDDNNKILAEKAKELETKANELFTTAPDKLLKEATGKLPQIMFVILPVFALLLKIMFMFSKRLYMEHLTVALHSHSFIFLVTLLLELIDFLFDTLASPNSWLAPALSIWIPVYLFIMQKRVYQQGYIITFIKYMVISTLYFILLSIGATVAFVWGLMSS
ncbi:MAG: DUF3667 domain-containing protein [Thalassotalea sp.]